MSFTDIPLADYNSCDHIPIYDEYESLIEQWNVVSYKDTVVILWNMPDTSTYYISRLDCKQYPPSWQTYHSPLRCCRNRHTNWIFDKNGYLWGIFGESPRLCRIDLESRSIRLFNDDIEGSDILGIASNRFILTNRGNCGITEYFCDGENIERSHSLSIGKIMYSAIETPGQDGWFIVAQETILFVQYDSNKADIVFQPKTNQCDMAWQWLRGSDFVVIDQGGILMTKDPRDSWKIINRDDIRNIPFDLDVYLFLYKYDAYNFARVHETIFMTVRGGNSCYLLTISPDDVSFIGNTTKKVVPIAMTHEILLMGYPIGKPIRFSYKSPTSLPKNDGYLFYSVDRKSFSPYRHSIKDICSMALYGMNTTCVPSLWKNAAH